MTQPGVSIQQALELALLHHQGGRFDDAMAVLRQVIAIQPGHAGAWNQLACALQQSGQVEQAIAVYRQALALAPDDFEFHNNLGTAFQTLNRMDDAIAEYRRSVQLKPDFPDAHNNLALTLLASRRIDDALASHRRAVELIPDHPLVHHNYGLTLLLIGEMELGWKEYEWRWKVKALGLTERQFTQPRGEGDALNGQRILLTAEQGFGDSIQFARCAALLIARGARVILETPQALVRLFRDSFGSAVSIAPANQPLPDFDLWCPLLSVPGLLQIDLKNIPTSIPYIRAASGLVEHWRDKLADQKLKIGLAWAGTPTHRADRQRSILPAQLAPLAKVIGASFISLQKDNKHPAPDLSLIDWTNELNDFADTAALVENLDLIITVDTAVAHLSGAMGKPTWVLLPFVPDWRWQLDGAGSPWYPTMRLFRQRAIGDWNAPIADIVRAAQEFKINPT